MKVLFSANDPGGAEAILPVVIALRAHDHTLQGILTGPAKYVFTRAGVPFIDADEHRSEGIRAAQAFAPDVLLAGTSGSISIDKELLMKFRESVPSVYVLDFWGNYGQRFSGEAGDLKFLPSVTCVMDDDAKRGMIAIGIPEERIVVTGSPHFEEFEKGVTRDAEDHSEVLFVSQPLSISAERFGFDEFTVLSMLKEAVATMPEDYHLRIRLHPRDEAHKYDTHLSARVILGESETVQASLSRAGLVVGMFSPVLLQAAAAGKQVVSIEPGLVGPDLLPLRDHEALAHVQSFEELRALLAKYAQGEPIAHPELFRELAPRGAAERIVSVLERVVGS